MFDHAKAAPRAKSPAAPPPKASAKLDALRGQGLEAQRAALRPGNSGYDSQRAAQRPAPSNEDALKAKVADAAIEATHEAIEEQANDKKKGEARHPLLKRIGDRIGLGLGILVTRALKYVDGWNKPVLDEQGAEVDSVKGAERVGDHAIEKRHMEFVGPKILAFVKGLKPGRIHDFLEGVGEGATRAPGETYRREVAEAGA